MSTHSPSHNQTTPRRRRDGLIWLILLALLLALVPIGCIAELALRLVVPANDPFKDVGSSSSLGAYAPFPGGISYAAVDPYAPNVRATEVSRRERLTPVALRGAVTVAPVAEVGPPVGQFVPPTPTLTTPPTPRPTVTPGPPLPPPAAGGAQPSPTATEMVLIPGMTATPAPSSSPTRTPTRGPTGEPSATATRQPGQPTPSAPPIVASPTPDLPPPTATEAPSLTPSAIILPSPTLVPVAPTTTQTPPVVPAPTETPPLAPTPTETPPLVPTPTETPPPTATEEPPPPTPTEEPPPPPPELSINAAVRTEGAPGETRLMTFTVGLSRQASGTVTVRYGTVAASGETAATPGADYTPVSGVLTFSPGQQQQTFTVPIVGEDIVEYDEIFGVQLSSPTGALIAVGSATGTIVNDDLAVARLEPQSRTVSEGDAPSTTSVNFDIVISDTLSLERPVSVSYATREVAGGAVGTGPNRDFIATSGSLTFNPGGPTRQLFTITVVGDNTPELDEQFLVDLTPGLATTIAPPATGTVVIANDDQATIAIGDAPLVLEGNAGTTDAVFTVTRNGPSAQAITIQYDTVQGSGPGAATEGDDYLPPAPRPGTVVIPASPAASATVQIRVPVVGDTVDEVDEFFFVDLLSATNATITNARGRAVIDDDDGPTVTLTTIAGSAVEGTPPGAGGTLQFSVQPSAASPQDVIVTYEVVGSGANQATPGADFTVRTPLTLTFPANAAPAPQLITIDTVPDNIVEPDETFTVRIVSVVDGFPGTPSSAIGTILLDDYIDVGLAISPSSVTEGNAGASTPVGVTVSLSRAAPVPVSVGLGVGGTATPGSDFTLAPATVNIPANTAGPTAGSATITVIGDGLVETDETVVLSLASGSQAYLRLAPGGQTLTILDDDTATVTVGNASMLEGNGPGTTSMVFPVAINPVPTFPVTITWATQATGTATPGSDYVASSGTVTLGGSVGSGTVSVPIVGDLAVERDETFQVALSGPVPPRIILPSGPATGTILNDDAVAVSFDKTGVSVSDWRSEAGGVYDDATWTITVINTGTTSVNVALTDDFSGLPYPIFDIDSSATINGVPAGTAPSRAGNRVSWSGTLAPGAELNLTMGVILQLQLPLEPPPPLCDQVVNPSYQISVDGSPPTSFLNEAPVDVGDCVAAINAVSPQPAASGKRSAVLTSSDTPLYTPTPTVTATPTAAPTATPTATHTPRPTATDEPTPTSTPTDEPTRTPTATDAPTRTPTDEPEPTTTRTPTDEPEPTATRTPKPTATDAPTRTPTDEPAPTRTPTDEPEPTATRTPTDEPTATKTPTEEPEPTATKMPTRTPTDEPEPTRTPTDEPAPTAEPYPPPGEPDPPTATREPPTRTAAPPTATGVLATSTLAPTVAPERKPASPTPEPQPVQPPAEGSAAGVAAMGLGGGALLPYGLLAALVIAIARRRR